MVLRRLQEVLRGGEGGNAQAHRSKETADRVADRTIICLLYTSDAADE